MPRFWVSTLFLFILIWSLPSCDDEKENPPTPNSLQLSFLRLGTYNVNLSDAGKNVNAPVDKPLVGGFTSAISRNSVQNSVTLKEKESESEVPLIFSFLDNDKTFSASPQGGLKNATTYVAHIGNELTGANNEAFSGFEIEFTTISDALEIISLHLSGTSAITSERITDVATSNFVAVIQFSDPLDEATISSQTISLAGGNSTNHIEIALSEDATMVTITSSQKLKDLSRFSLILDAEIAGAENEVFEGFTKDFYTGVDPEPDHATIPDESLLTLVQQQTFKYFWDFAQPNSGMARERNTSGDLVTSGGSGFGIMSIIVGIERGFITRQQGLERMDRILDFLETADRFHGAWSHWINGNSGNVIPFSVNDNGGDLVETSFLVQGLLTFRQYLNSGVAEEVAIIDRINALWQTVEWDWYTRDGQNVLYWHWSPDKEWAMNHQINGYNEALITYVLAASSPTHPIDADVYHEGWANNGGIVSGKNFYNITLPLGFDYGGPLFFTHYSFLGLDPRTLQDTYANYWTQNVNHSLINHAYVVDNPGKFVGYSDENWGLTASDNHEGYSAHSPTNDLGVITPTAALSSFPYTPAESMKALKFFYYTVGDRLWGDYGFYDAYNPTEAWVASSYLAIDQGPIIVMIENYRTGLLWDLFMSAPEVQNGLTKLGSTY